jgi:mannosidase alpha-like ER degradation enhancer 1
VCLRPLLTILLSPLTSSCLARVTDWNLWRRYGGIPESFHVVAKDSDNLEYPFRPEFVESTYYLYQATKDPFYLEVGEQILEDLETYGLVSSEDSEPGRGCGLAGWTLGDGTAGRMDRMESFALSETLKVIGHLS